MNMMSDINIGDLRVDEMIRRWDELKGLRIHHEQDWEDIAWLMRPQRGGFGSADPAQARNNKALSSIAIMAQTNFTAGLFGTMTNPANKWFALTTEDQDLAQRPDMANWLSTCSQRTLSSFGPAVSPFYSATIQLFGDVSSFGNGAQYDELKSEERKIMDVTVSLAEIVYDIDAFGQVCEVVRKFRLTARAASGMFGHDNLGPKMQERAQKGGTDKFDFYHHVKKNVDWRKGVLGPVGKRWLSMYGSGDDKHVLRLAGYAEMPFHAPRWEVDTGQVMGIGPGQIALPSSRVLQQIKAANLRAGQSAADRTLLAPEKETWALSGRVRPGEVIYGGVNSQGQKMVHALDNVGLTGLTLEIQNQVIEEIRDAWHWSLMNLAQRTGMTATEVIERQEERTRLMAPNQGRIQEEYLAPKIARRFQMLWRAGQLPPPPEGTDGADLRVEYTSAAAMAQRSAEGAAVNRILADISPLASIKPRLMDRIDEDGMLEALVAARGAPQTMIRSRDEADALGQQRAEQEQAAAGMAALQAGGGVAKDLAAAGLMGAE